MGGLLEKLRFCAKNIIYGGKVCDEETVKRLVEQKTDNVSGFMRGTENIHDKEKEQILAVLDLIKISSV